MVNISIYNNKHNLSKQIAYKILSLSYFKKDIHIALSGGNTPKFLFDYLVQLNMNFNINWNNIHFWWVDERYVPYDHSDSNYGIANKILFNNIDIDRNNLHPIPIIKNKTTYDSICLYKHIIEKSSIIIKNELPQFDLIILGVGEDGHTASLFPYSLSLKSNNWLIQDVHPITRQERISITIPVINNALMIDVLIVGKNKKKIVNNILKIKSKYYPINMINNDNIFWHFDFDSYGIDF